jgi:RNA-directed DNA polymerase
VAWERVAANAGSKTPGIDRATVAWIETRIGVEVFLQEIRNQLKARMFQPVAVSLTGCVRVLPHMSFCVRPDV